MKMRKISKISKNICLVLLLGVVLVSCGKQSGRTLTSATGSIYECLVIVPQYTLSQEQKRLVDAEHLQKADGSSYVEDIVTLYDAVKAILGADMPCMPQMEPYFKLTQVTPAQFDHLLMPTRNILYVDIDPARYTQVTPKAQRDVWSTPQAVYRIQSPNEEAFLEYWLAHGKQIRDWFVMQEITRQQRFYRASTEKDIRKHLNAAFHADMLVPNDYMLLMDTVIVPPVPNELLLNPNTQIVWACNNKGSLRRDLIVYSYPYTDAETFMMPYLNAQRDAILSRIVTSGNGARMATEYNVFPPEMRTLTIDSTYTVEIRGLWKMVGGEAMGGPYVSHTWLDPVHARVVTAEVFVFAPGQKKRNPLRQAEAILYSRTHTK